MEADSSRPAVPPTPIPELNQVLAELAARLKALLGDDLIGVYLQGSFAVGDFDGHSDVDFIVVTAEELAPEQVQALQAMHEQVHNLDTEWAKHLEGSYFPREVLNNPIQRGADLWYLDHGARSLVRSAHCNTLVVRWVAREKGVTLAGPDPETLVDPISVDLLRQEMKATLESWGKEILADPEPYRNRFYQAFIVLSYCRMPHDIWRGFPGSKRAGAEWAKKALAPEWQDLIDRAWEGRPDPARQVKEPADPIDFQRTLAFVEYVMSLYETEEANRQLASRPP
jgi:predicted nucleotidyltransferase